MGGRGRESGTSSPSDSALAPTPAGWVPLATGTSLFWVKRLCCIRHSCGENCLFGILHEHEIRFG
jgi:hypothetical protein